MMDQSLMASVINHSSIYADLLNHLSEMVYVFDDKGRMVFMNHAAEEFEGIKLSDVKGLYVSDIYYQDYSPTLKALETGKEVEDVNNVYMIRGKQFRQITKSYPVFDQGKVIGVFTIQTDVTTLEKILSENIRLQKKVTKADDHQVVFDSLIGKSPEFIQCVDIARSAAKNDSPVLLSGATGTGKEVFAKSIHNASARRKGPYLAINCAAIPETLLESILFGTVKGSFTGAMDKPGLFEQAKGGTLFLDEINSMPLGSQAKILRVLEEKECRRVGGDKDIKIDVRIISSINCTPKELLEEKIMRADLFYRLAVISILIPPLCERKDDLTLFIAHFIRIYNQKLNRHIRGLDLEAEKFFYNFSWPGNVRQLKHAIESAVGMAEEGDERIEVAHLPQYLFENKLVVDNIKDSNNDQNDHSGNANQNSRINQDNPGNQEAQKGQENQKSQEKRDGQTEVKQITDGQKYLSRDVREQVRQEECERIIQTLYECGGNVSKTARVLNIHRQSLIYKMKKYNIR